MKNKNVYSYCVYIRKINKISAVGLNILEGLYISAQNNFNKEIQNVWKNRQTILKSLIPPTPFNIYIYNSFIM